MSEEHGTAAIVNRFLALYLEDQRRGRVHDLSVYQARFPGFEAVIAYEHGLLTSEPPPDVPRHIGPYRVLRELGRGSQGTVYLTQDTRLPRKAAVKVLRGLASLNRADRLRFVREAELASKLDHPGICTVYEVGEADGTAYIAMRPVEGVSLARWIEQRRAQGAARPADLDTALAVVEALARAVHAAHRIGVVHRDIKPGNVLLDAEGRPVLTDFGTAHALDGETLTLSGEVLGTPAYMAPEQVSGRARQFDWRMDVYALGVTLYECVTLRLPFAGATRDSVYRQILSADPPDPRRFAPHVPRDLVAVLELCLEKAAERRYETALALAEDLARVRRGEPTGARPIGPARRTLRRARRHPAQAALLGSVGLLGILALGLLVNRSRARAALEAEAEHVRQLAAFRDLETLVQEADRLWPPTAEQVPRYERWMQRATALTTGLEPDPATERLGYRAELTRLRARALPRSEEGIELERRAHPLYEDYRRFRVQLDAWQRAEEVRNGRARPLEYTLAPDEFLPSTLAGLTTTVFDIVFYDPENAPRALAIARLALERATSDAERADVLSVEALALMRIGRLDEARAASARALSLASDANRAEVEDLESRLRWFLDRYDSGEQVAWLAQEEARLERMWLEIESRRTWEFASPEDGWWHAQLTRLVREIERLGDVDSGLIQGVTPEHSWGVERRLEHARTVRERTLASEEAARRWRQVRADLAADPCTADLEIEPVEGLLPLGRDPVSGLQEFADVLTGDPPVRGPDGGLVRTESTGLVLVLLPGGVARMGAQSSDPGAPHFVAAADSDEGPVHEVRLTPFLLSKYEMTQGQWLRMTRTNPSSYGPANWSPSMSREPITLFNPVEGVSWNEARALLELLGLRLPTEAEWEYAARAGTGSAWPTGDEEAALEGFANLQDAWAAGSGPTSDAVPWSDEHRIHAAVGSFRANGFGLHDMAGNVREWCLDCYLDQYIRVVLETSCQDPWVDPGRGTYQVVRGGSYRSGSNAARSSYRANGKEHLGYDDVGLRPARSLPGASGTR